MESVALAAIIEIVAKNGLINLDEILQYRIRKESLSVLLQMAPFKMYKEVNPFKS